ncbi:DUF6920 family protein [Gudongella sp. SC589]|uniref:DUF6920 family protein n=1 Tax=Gudongella sp. SC589 TaxID=3385990 RepID=UPI003904831F
MDTILYVVGIILLVYFLLTKIPGGFHKRRINKEIRKLKEMQVRPREGNIEMKDIAHLPEIVQRWLIKSNIVGSQWKSTVHIKQKGQMRLDPDSEKWIFASATQVVGMTEPSFVWQVKAEVKPFIYVYGADSYLDGVGSLQMRLLNLIKVADVKGGPKVNQSSFQRYLLELPWYPQAALNRNMKWKQIDKHTARVVMNHRGVPGEAYLRFDDEGDVVFTSAMRFKDTDDKAELLECIGESKEINLMDGIRMPILVHVTWRLPERLYTWFKVQIFKLEYR